VACLALTIALITALSTPEAVVARYVLQVERGCGGKDLRRHCLAPARRPTRDRQFGACRAHPWSKLSIAVDPQNSRGSIGMRSQPGYIPSECGSRQDRGIHIGSGTGMKGTYSRSYCIRVEHGSVIILPMSRIGNRPGSFMHVIIMLGA